MAEGFVYAIASEVGTVKIGWSADPFRRFAKVKADAAVPCRLVGYMEGSRGYEASLHDDFRALRVCGEWFRNEGVVADFVSSIPPHLHDKESVLFRNNPESTLATWIADNGHDIYSFGLLVGASGASVSRWAAGKIFPAVNFLKAILLVTGGQVTPNDLLHDMQTMEAANV